ncbi:MAG: ComF family protein, partial [candidate division Zixibacteria bacterium]|nr:ComF family protein [candidate division Zixibacteria bacterium]
KGVACPGCEKRGPVLLSVADYSGPVREIIVNYKFHGVTAPSGLFAAWWSDQYSDMLTDLAPDFLLPIPLHPDREYSRGYNQAEVFAQALSETLDLPVRDDLLVRIRRRKLQSRLRRSERARNIRGVFACDVSDDAAREAERVIIVDDVVTSGATVLEARRVLERNGINVVAVASIAHGL